MRGAQGLLVSTTERTGSYASAQSTQMDALEAAAQLKSAQELGSRLSDAAQTSGALALTSLLTGASDEHSAAWLTEQVDVKQKGQLSASLNSQTALYNPTGSRSGSDPVHQFAQPVIVLDTPASACALSDGLIAQYAGEHLSYVAQGDVQHSSAHTASLVSGGTTSLFTHSGGLQVKAASGALSLRAHTDTLQLLAHKEIQILSVNDEITVSAQSKIELIAADSGITLEGGNITFTTPGTWVAKGSVKEFVGGASGTAEMPALPTGLQQFKNWIEINHRDPDNLPMAGQNYKIFFEGGAVVSGALDAQGHARHENVPDKAVRVEYEPRSPQKDAPWDPLSELVAEVQKQLA